MKRLSPRTIFGITFLACLLAMLFALYLEEFKGIQPCPLCVLQRIAVVALGIIALIATLHNPKKIGQRIYSFFCILACAGGLTFSIRQLWLQSLPPGDAPSCGAGIGYMFENMPLKEFLLTLFKGTGDCAVVHWEFLSLSIAGWVTVFATVFLLIHLWQIFRRSHTH